MKRLIGPLPDLPLPLPRCRSAGWLQLTQGALGAAGKVERAGAGESRESGIQRPRQFPESNPVALGGRLWGLLTMPFTGRDRKGRMPTCLSKPFPVLALPSASTLRHRKTNPCDTLHPGTKL